MAVNTTGVIDTNGFDSTFSGSITGSGLLTKVDAGTLTISGPQNRGPGAVLTLAEGSTNLNTDAGVNVIVNANATTNFGTTQHLAALNVGAGATATITTGGPKNVVTGALSIAGGGTPTGKLDLANNGAILDYAMGSPAATVRAQILAGRGGPGFGAPWTGMGITSSAAATANATEPESRSVGYAENSALPLGPYTNFRGQPVDDTSVLLAYTRTGDANLDGVVNDDDVTIIGATYAPGVPQPHWALGDFDYNGFVDDDDVTLLGVFYDPSATPIAAPGTAVAAAPASGVAAVPEPGSLLLAAFALAALAAGLARRAIRVRRER